MYPTHLHNWSHLHIAGVSKFPQVGVIPDMTHVVLGPMSVLMLFALSIGLYLNGGMAPSGPRTGERSDSPDPHPTCPPKQRVIQLVRANGGRMYQQELVDEMDRSDASVSRYLSALEDERRIYRLRDGRNNLVMVPEELPSTGFSSLTETKANQDGVTDGSSSTSV